ncbi:MAG TPA: GtrA family protein [Firmicutes bacterium]|nr:GtrA family protein [Candidatus Fermentithermobacillaceae bacterium]
MRKAGKRISVEELQRFARFSMTGVTNTVVDFGVFFVLAHLVGVSVYVSQFIAYSTATVNSYFINRNWTFRQKGRFTGGEFARFVIVNTCSLGLSLLCLRFFYGYLHLPKMIAKAVTACFTLPVNYFGSRLWVFRGSRDTE